MVDKFSDTDLIIPGMSPRKVLSKQLLKRITATQKKPEAANVAWIVEPFIEWAAQNFEDQKYLIEGLIPEKGLVQVSGPSKRARKTLTISELAVCACLGHDFGLFKTARPLKTLFIEEEGLASETRRLFEIITKDYGCSIDDLTNLYWSFHQRIKLDEPSWVSKLCEYIQSESFDMVILDPITYMHLGDENDAQSMRKVTDALSQIRSCGPSVVYLVHVGKGTAKDIDTGPRGSSLLSNVYDIHLGIRPGRNTDSIPWILRSRHQGERYFTAQWRIRSNGMILESISLNIHESQISSEPVSSWSKDALSSMEEEAFDQIMENLRTIV